MNEVLSFPPVNSSVAGRSVSSSSKPTARTSAFLQQRMEMNGSTRPAATVTRRSNNQTMKVQENVEEKETEDWKRRQPQEQQIQPPATILVGEVIERPQMPISSYPPKTSIRAQRRVPTRGFPSILNQPIGTFARAKKTGDTITTLRSPSPSRTASKQREHGGAASATREIIAWDDVGISGGSSSADAILSQMSSQEIQGSIQELQEALSPELLQFLKNRGQKTSAAVSSNLRPKLQVPSATITCAELLSIQDAAVSIEEAKEKERLTNILSSIRTYDDLDEAYEREVGLPERDGLEGKSEWDQACILLRSTSPRQTLWAARILCRDLERDVEQQTSFRIGSSLVWPYPTLLPVSLRCLLDANVTHTNGLALHSYVLRSIYALLKLRAPMEHVVDVSGTQLSPYVIHQTVFMDDAVPTSRFGSLYPSIAATPMLNNKDGETVAYATSSSSASAHQDGEAFVKDPMWTLLSKMQIVPLIAQLLNSHYDLPEEGLVAISGILAMLSARSPGAASAISQHSHLLKSLLKQSVMPPRDDKESHFLNAHIMLPVMILLNTMARQSRVVASAIPYMDFLPPLLALQADDLVDVQRWALILWRKLLRYGIGISGISSLVALSIIPRNNGGELTSEYCSTFASLLDCSRVFAAKSDTTLHETLSGSDKEILASAVSWLSPSARQYASRVCVFGVVTEDATVLTVHASMLRLLSSFASAWTHSSEDKDNIMHLALLFEDSNVVNNLSVFLASDVMERILRLVPMHSSSENVSMEAAASCFLSELITFVTTLDSLEYRSADPNFSLVVATLRRLLKAKLFGCRIEHFESEVDFTHGWIKQCHFVVSKFLLSEGGLSDDDRTLLRLFVINLIGRLDLGDESKAAILFSSDFLFHGDEGTLSEPRSELFMRELCGSESARKQLDHSYKLHRGFGITVEGWGPFAMESLLSDADRGPGSDCGLLPIGKMWTWQALSGSLGVSGHVDEDVPSIVTSFLSFLLHLEDDYERIGSTFDPVPTGAKLYFLLNTFLYPESILSNQDLRAKASALLDKITPQLGPQFALEFMAACFDHSLLKRSSIDDPADGKDEKLLAVLSGTPDASTKSVRALQELSLDLCNAYVEHGAQYEECTKAIRVLLRPQFPSKIRCEVLQRLREVSHLLTLDAESANDVDLANSVEEVLLEGILPTGERDSAELLDVLTDILRSGQGGNAGFFFLYAVSTLSRALMGSMRSCTGLNAMERRISLLPLIPAMVIMNTCSTMKNQDATRSQIVAAAMVAKAAAAAHVATTSERMDQS